MNAQYFEIKNKFKISIEQPSNTIMYFFLLFFQVDLQFQFTDTKLFI